MEYGETDVVFVMVTARPASWSKNSGTNLVLGLVGLSVLNSKNLDHNNSV